MTSCVSSSSNHAVKTESSASAKGHLSSVNERMHVVEQNPEVDHLKQELEHRDSKLTRLQAEIMQLRKQLKCQMDMSVTFQKTSTQENETLACQLRNAKNRIRVLEDVHHSTNEKCKSNSCKHRDALKSIEAKFVKDNQERVKESQSLTAQLRKSEEVVKDLQQKLMGFLCTMKFLETSLTKFGNENQFPKVAVQDDSEDSVEIQEIPVEKAIKSGLQTTTISRKTDSSHCLDIILDPVPARLQPIPYTQKNIKQNTVAILPSTSNGDARRSAEVREMQPDKRADNIFPRGSTTRMPEILPLVSSPEKTSPGAFLPQGLQPKQNSLAVPRLETALLQCTSCKKNFKFNRDNKIFGTDESKAFKCTICKKLDFKKPANLYSEIQRNSHKAYKCSVCNKIFGFPSKLRNHLRTHTGEKPFHCDICGKSFSLFFNLKIHRRTHSGEKPFTCKVCGKTFRQSKSLVYHSNMHNAGKQNFKCKICYKTFDLPFHLKKHVCGEAYVAANTFNCEVCGKTFSSPDLLSIHQITHSWEQKQQLYQCSSCCKMFTSGYLKNHSCQESEKKLKAKECNPTASDSTTYYPGKADAKSKKIDNFQNFSPQSGRPLPSRADNLSMPAATNNNLVTPPSLSAHCVSSTSGSTPFSNIASASYQLGQQIIPKEELVHKEDRLSQGSIIGERAVAGKGETHKRDLPNQRLHQQPEFYDISELAVFQHFT